VKIHVLRSPEYSKDEFKKVADLLKMNQSSMIFISYPKTSIEYKSQDHIKNWDEFFINCSNWRIQNNISNDDYVFLLTEYANTEDYFSWTDEALGNYFIHTAEWERYFENYTNKHFAISYEVYASILRSLMYDTQEELLENAHRKAKGCVMDYCDEKEDITLKMRTGDVCYTCLKRIKERNINMSFLGNIFNAMESIRKGLMFRERNEIIGHISPIKIQLGVNRPKFKIVDANNEPLTFDDSQTAIYLFLLKIGTLKLSSLADHKDVLMECYKWVKNGNIEPSELNLTIRSWVNPDNKESFVQKVSKINSKIKKILGSKIGENYMIQKIKAGQYKIPLGKNLVIIEYVNNGN